MASAGETVGERRAWVTMMRAPLLTVLLSVASSLAVPVHAQLTSPQVGWRAELSKLAHNVSGSVTIVDENTVRVDDFTYDGGGIVVKFYLGQENTRNAFLSGRAISDDLFGHAYNGNGPPLVFDLPAGQTLQGWNAISVWCVTAGANFGSGTFAPVGAPHPGDFNEDGAVDAADYVVWRDGLGGEYEEVHLADWRANFGRNASSAANPIPFPMMSVPEPALVSFLIAVAAIGLPGRRSFVGNRRM
jgi:hypothetical protein